LIKIPKKPSYNTTPIPPQPFCASPIRLIVSIIAFLFLYICLPLYAAVHLRLVPMPHLLLFYIIVIAVIVFSVQKALRKNDALRHSVEDIQEKFNIAKDENTTLTTQQSAILAKIIRYNSLKEIIEKINESLDIHTVADHLTAIAFSLLANNKGTCILYLVDQQTQKLNIFKTKKEDSSLIIKSKEGDIFDLWVTKHTGPLVIENLKEDFRFDLEKIGSHETRHCASLIAAPFMSENKFLGLLRLDNTRERFYSTDDLRVLVSLCDLGAVALENAQLYQKTQDLAIHDSLTTLYTKEYFLARLKEECKRSTRGKAHFSLLLLDIDNFKNYNDQFGHMAGDMVLKTLSATVTGSLKGAGTIISRFGGEEFCVIVPGVDKENAHTIAERLRKKIEETTMTLRRQETNITVSIGVATFPIDAADAEEVIVKADKAMYEAKQKGRNRVVDARPMTP